MGLFGVAFILITFGYIAWEQRNRLIQRNLNEIAGNAFFLADHIARLLEVTDLSLKQTAAEIQGESWDRIERSRPLWKQLRGINEALPYIDDVWLNDATGNLRLTSVAFPTPSSNVAGRDAFDAQALADQGLFIGEPIVGRVMGRPTFMISRRLSDPDGAFAGTVSVTVALSYFDEYWGKLRLPKGSRISLLRASDGEIIAQYPPPADRLSFVPLNEDAFYDALILDARSGIYSFIGNSGERAGAYHRVGTKPLYIHVSLPEDAYWNQWVVQARLYGAFALIALLALAALTALASQQFKEQTATSALLEREVAARTAELKAETGALEILNRTGSALAGELDVGRIVQNVTDAGVELTHAQIGAFFVTTRRSEDGVSLALQALSGASSASFAEAAQDLDAAPFPVELANGKVLRSEDIEADPRFATERSFGAAFLSRCPARSFMAVPVLSRAGAVGGVLLFAHEQPGIFTERAEHLMAGLAAQAAIALENGRLYQDAQREIDDRRHAQRQQSLLIRELHHRVKNTLATVQAVVGATARSTSSIDDFYKAFVGRIVSLANTHSLLTEAVWQTASLREILEKELSPYSDGSGERIVLDGPIVELPSEAAVPIGMAIHELTTNAAKYGALSVSTGRVSVTWTSEPEADGYRLRLVWSESGGPEVSPPERQGFGSRLLHRVLATQLSAKVDVDYRPKGLQVAIEAVLKPTTLIDTLS
ncbi:HWE histidine kinase domain-containing protein [Microvirga roseola]|uniref:HWE histidine kinase domain-containing protein n=1 Tax=Microvirga roseola TaxID=2883126 RepID=UPI001E5DC6E0|nr:HWE histidine kinase domain-containing protein [Microvirga roseola]